MSIPKSKKKRTGGMRLAVLGLLLGLSLGLAKHFLERFLGNFLVELLHEEAVEACNCEFKVDEMEFSLLRMRARAENARLTLNGENQIFVPEIIASFNPISRIRDLRLALTDLDLINARINQVDPSGGAFQFIDHLAIPLTPEEKEEFKLRIKLLRLRVINGTFKQDFIGKEITGEGVELLYIRDELDNLILTPKAEKLIFHTVEDNSIEIGELTSSLYITDDDLSMKEIALELGESFVKISGKIDKIKDELIKTDFAFNLHAENILKGESSGRVDGTGGFSGSLDSPKLSLSISTPEEIYYEDEDRLIGPLSIETVEKSDEASQEHLSFRFQELTFSDVTLLDGSFDLYFTKQLEKEDFQITGLLGGIRTNDLLVPSLNIDLAHKKDTYNLSVVHESSELGSGQISGVLSETDSSLSIDSLDINLQDLALLNLGKEKSFDLKNLLLLTVDGNFSGPLSLSKVTGNGTVSIATPSFLGESALRGDLTLREGVLNSTLGNASQSLMLDLKLPLIPSKEGQAKLSLNQFQPKEYNPKLDCVETTLNAQYTFQSEELYGGDGSIALEELILGCAPYQTKLRESATLPVNGGRVQLKNLAFQSQESSLAIDGDVGKDGINLSAKGDLLLKSLVPLLPFLDDLSGELLIDAEIFGPLENPEITGSTKIVDAGIALESGNIIAENIAGDISISSGNISIDNVRGKINNGDVILSGEFDPNDLESATLEVRIENALYDVSEDFNLALSADLFLAKNQLGRPVIRGDIELVNLEFVKEFELRTAIGEVSHLLVGKADSSDNERGKLPELELDINIKAERNFFVITSFLGAELAGDITIRGEMDKPVITGEIETLRGWLGLRETRFDISSAVLNFRAGALTPTVSFVAESSVRGRGGQNILVLLEGQGPLLNPEITLSSDTGLSEREILSLLGTRSDFRISSSTFTNESELEISAFRGEVKKETLIGNFFRSLTTIDSLSFEPKFNARRGLLEPALIAEKNLAPGLDLLGESFLSGPEDGSQIFLRYSLSKRTQLLGSLDTVNTEERTSFGADIAFSIYSNQIDSTKFITNGNERYSTEEILAAQRLSGRSRITADSVPQLGKNIEKFYQEKGFESAAVVAECNVAARFCEEIELTISEGPRRKIVKASSDIENMNTLDERLLEIKEDQPYATKELLEEIELQVLQSLRSDGYLQARVQGEYLPGSEENTVELRIRVERGNAVSFIFEGNESFTDRELLETINLFNRRQPFGNNTINILTRNIEKLYRNAGYLYVTIGVSEETSDEVGRTVYSIKISEEEKVSVKEVRIEGLETLTLRDLEQHFTDEESSLQFNEIFTVDYAVKEELDRTAAYLTEALIMLGFEEASVNVNIEPDETKPETDVIHIVDEGPRLYAENLVVLGVPDTVDMPELPNAPYSIPKANRYITSLVTSLRDGGYLSSDLWSEAKDGELILQVHPGEREVISAITVNGAKKVEYDEIVKNLTFDIGDPLTATSLIESKRKLLRLGLFSRVEISSTSEGDGKSEIEIDLEERPFQTLELGGGVNSEFGLHIFGEALDRELFSDGRVISLRFDTFYDDTAADISRGLGSLRYIDPNFLESGIGFSEDFRYQKTDLSTQEFNLDRFSLSSIWSDTDEDFSWSFGHTILLEDLQDVTPGAVLDPDLDTGEVQLSFFGGNFAFDKRDNQLNPKSGYSFKLDWHVADEAIWSDTSYAQLDARVTYLKPFDISSERFGIALGLRGGRAWSYDGDTSLPISQRFYLGGRTTVRGFRENSLGPRGFDDAVIGGDILMLLNSEFRYYPSDTFSLHTFLDAGTVYLSAEDISFGEIRRGAGIGFRYHSPIGPVGFDIGAPVDERGGEPSVRFHFSIGSTF